MMARKPKTDTPASSRLPAPERMQQPGVPDQIAHLWKRLATVGTLHFSVRGSASRGAMDYDGSGRVRITWLDTATMEYDEEGAWQHPSGKIIHFRNIYRWVRDDIAGCLKLYHRRNDAVDPVFLCEFVPSETDQPIHATPHICGRDTYLGELRLTGDGVELRWRISGPAKNDRLTIVYHFGSSPETDRSEMTGTHTHTR
jgi:Family of unknown function (DUF6314)